MEPANIIRELLTDNDRQMFDYAMLKSLEYIQSGCKGRVILSFQQGRLNDVQDQPIVAGASQAGYYIQKLKVSLNLTPT